MGTWNNDDGLHIRYGETEVVTTKGGAKPPVGGLNHFEVVVELADLSTTAAIVGEGLLIPNNHQVVGVDVFMEVAATSGGSATLDVGLVDQDRSTAIDDDGLVAALALASIDAEGDSLSLVQGSTGHGALVGDVITNTGYVTASYNTAAFTAGVARITVKTVPLTDVSG